MSGAFLDKLDEEAMEYFNSVAAKPFSGQAVAFLNAYWDEVGDQAEFMYEVAWTLIQHIDMESKGISLFHKYTEGFDLDFDMGLKFFEHACKFVEDPAHNFFTTTCGPWGKANKDFQEKYSKSLPEMMTSIVRKKELKEKVDVNFDGRVSFLEYLLYQYREYANPADFCVRSMKAPDEHPEVKKAREALEAVNKSIAAYEAEKHRLEEESKLDGVKGLRAKNELAQLNSGPLWETLNKDLITAEAAVRIATKKFGGAAGGDGAAATKTGRPSMPAQGAIWWMNHDLAVKKKRYGKQEKKGE
eukprot:GFYU01006089.1.p1 GENE.GFYU01006089.1~~GFYU01006089.1.p1  ORF type:complete len:301 (+),score=122.90 GFYU01006089.1:96-998(+)